jgi:hypothetical protein
MCCPLPGAAVVSLSGPRTWDSNYMNEIALALFSNKVSEHLLLIHRCGVYSTEWPQFDNIWTTVDCTGVFDSPKFNPQADGSLEELLQDELGLLPEIDEIVLELTAEKYKDIKAKHLDELFHFVRPKHAWVSGKEREIANCYTSWRDLG